MNSFIKVRCPAKINLTLEVVNRRDDGFHNIKSIMHLIDLYDYLTIKITEIGYSKIVLSGNNVNIPYDERNLVYKAANLFLKNAGFDNYLIEIFIEKNIPISAGLAGGSTDAAGTLWGLNRVFNCFSEKELHKMCSELGSDLNVCLEGGCSLATSRGEVTKKITPVQSSVTLIKPKYLGISASEAYKKYAHKEFKPHNNMTEKMLDAIDKNNDISAFLYNDLEYAVFEDYAELQEIKKAYPSSIMSGSGSTYFVLADLKNNKMNDDYEFISGLKTIPDGICEIG